MKILFKGSPYIPNHCERSSIPSRISTCFYSSCLTSSDSLLMLTFQIMLSGHSLHCKQRVRFRSGIWFPTPRAISCCGFCVFGHYLQNSVWMCYKWNINIIFSNFFKYGRSSDRNDRMLLYYLDIGKFLIRKKWLLPLTVVCRERINWRITYELFIWKWSQNHIDSRTCELTSANWLEFPIVYPINTERVHKLNLIRIVSYILQTYICLLQLVIKTLFFPSSRQQTFMWKQMLINIHNTAYVSFERFNGYKTPIREQIQPDNCGSTFVAREMCSRGPLQAASCKSLWTHIANRRDEHRFPGHV